MSRPQQQLQQQQQPYFGLPFFHTTTPESRNTKERFEIEDREEDEEEDISSTSAS